MEPSRDGALPPPHVDTPYEDLFENNNLSGGNHNAMDDNQKPLDAMMVQNTEATNLPSLQVDAGVGGDATAQEGDNGAQQDDANTAADVEPPQPQGQEANVDSRDACKICFEHLDQADIIFLNCGCVYCEECLNAHFRSGLTNKASYPPVCCGPIDIAAVQGFLDDKNIIRYYNVSEEYDADRPIYCANKACEQGFIGAGARVSASDNNGMMICPECALETCATCRELRVAHADNDGVLECPDSLELAEVKEMADQESWRRCPGCRHLVEKTDGCDHMICDCRTEFHYVCGQEYGNDGRCGCTQNPGWGADGDQDGEDDGWGGNDWEGEDFEAQIPPEIQVDLHRPDDFPFDDWHGPDAEPFLETVIQDTRTLLDTDGERSEVVAAEDEITILRRALETFEGAFRELQTATTAVVRGRRLRAEEMLGHLEQAGGGAGRGGRVGRVRGRGGRAGLGGGRGGGRGGAEDLEVIDSM